MNSGSSFPYPDLFWFRLSAALVNIRTVHSMSASPLSVIEAIVKGVTLNLTESHNAVFFHIKNRKYTSRMRRGDRLEIDLFFAGTTRGFVEQWREELRRYLADPDTGKNFELLNTGEIEERSYKKLDREIALPPGQGEVCLEFLTPLSFKSKKGKPRTWLSKEQLIRSFEKRFSWLFGSEILYKAGEDDFHILPYYWHYTEIRRPSRSQPGTTQYISGSVGKLYIKGRFNNFLPFLVLGSELHAGGKISSARGYYRLYEHTPSFFNSFFPDKKTLIPVIRDVMERYDSALEVFTLEQGFPFNEDEFAETVVREIRDRSFVPSPHIAFPIKKKSGVERIVEQVRFRDLVVHRYVYRTISEIFDRMFEQESIGFRKGVSRQAAIEKVKSAVEQGYLHVIESDIEDFFPSVDLGILERLLDYYLPGQDGCIKDILKKIITTGYVLNGAYHERTRGLAQGSPLSPLLANLYLDSFDEKIQEWGVKMVRYSDDFIILTRTREQAEDILHKSEAYLNTLGLHIKKEKTSIKPVKEGFDFLGMRFDTTGTSPGIEEEFKGMRKPLYITEPGLYLFINGGAVDIKKGRRVIETIPLRRISEIMVMEKTVFSTALIGQCVTNNIPLTITLNTGYYITTVRPDSKKYYHIASQHSARYAALADTEILCFAREFAAGKIRNYITLFRQRYKKGRDRFITDLEHVLENIREAHSIAQIRGYEGAAARKIFRELNSIIQSGIFHIKKRERKKPDRINSMLNFGYYLLFSRINATVRAAGLNPYLGFLHSPADNYESLVCDIEELFRPWIDRLIVRLINLKIIQEEDFIKTERGLFLKREAVKRFLEEFETGMDRKKKGKLSLKESIYVQVLVIKKWVLENGSFTFYKWDI